MTTVLSYGGGVQSTAIACLIVSGVLPRPDRIVMADTGREDENTWRYLNAHTAPYLSDAGLHVEIAGHSMANVDLHTKDGRVLIPAYTTRSGRVGQLPNYCSVEWKRRVVHRWMRGRGIKAAELWLGISIDEAHRMKDSPVKWVTHRYPLIEHQISRAACMVIVRDAGLPEPPKSACWMCPYRSPREWASLTAADWESAKALDEDLRRRDPTLTLSRSGRPLSEEDKGGGQATLPGCDGGFCWT